MAALGVTLNATARDEHVGEAERRIRTLKERIRAMYNTMQFRFERLPARLIIEMAKSACFWLNCFPARNGVSKTLSPRTILTGLTIDHDLHCKHSFGQYVQTHEQHDNSNASRTIGALACRPTGSAQGNWFYFSLSTGRIIN